MKIEFTQKDATTAIVDMDYVPRIGEKVFVDNDGKSDIVEDIEHYVWDGCVVIKLRKNRK